MNRFHVAGSFVLATVAACVVYDKPPQNGQNTAATATPGTATAAPTATPTATAAPTGTVATTPPPGGTIAIPGLPPPGGTTAPPGGTVGAPPAGGFTLPGVCIPIGSWSKQFDNGIPATGTVDIGTPVLFNQFPVNDGVVIATMPAGNLKGVGAMTSTNDLSVDVTNGAITVSYTCHFTGSNCNQGQCTVTKGGLSGFKLIKK
jgi:hypothetical protein